MPRQKKSRFFPKRNKAAPQISPKMELTTDQDQEILELAENHRGNVNPYPHRTEQSNDIKHFIQSLKPDHPDEPVQKPMQL